VLTAHYTTPTMALNASSHNVAGEKTGPITAPPPALSDDIKKDVLDAANADGTGQSAPGRENEKGVEKKEKSAKELEKERKKAEKDAKFKAKKAAQTSGGAAGEAKEGAAPKEKKKKGKEEEQLPEYVEETPKGEKKRLQSLDGPFTKAYIPKVVESAWCKCPMDSNGTETH
jgi:valyl-tRNA synthetase